MFIDFSGELPAPTKTEATQSTGALHPTSICSRPKGLVSKQQQAEAAPVQHLARQALALRPSRRPPSGVKRKGWGGGSTGRGLVVGEAVEEDMAAGRACLRPGRGGRLLIDRCHPWVSPCALAPSAPELHATLPPIPPILPCNVHLRRSSWPPGCQNCIRARPACVADVTGRKDESASGCYPCKPCNVCEYRWMVKMLRGRGLAWGRGGAG